MTKHGTSTTTMSTDDTLLSPNDVFNVWKLYTITGSFDQSVDEATRKIMIEFRQHLAETWNVTIKDELLKGWDYIGTWADPVTRLTFMHPQHYDQLLDMLPVMSPTNVVCGFIDGMNATSIHNAAFLAKHGRAEHREAIRLWIESLIEYAKVYNDTCVVL